MEAKEAFLTRRPQASAFSFALISDSHITPFNRERIEILSRISASIATRRPDFFFMLGDNSNNSEDSRYWGFLEGWRLEGRAVLVYFSYNKDSLHPFPWIREIRWGRIGKVVH